MDEEKTNVSSDSAESMRFLKQPTQTTADTKVHNGFVDKTDESDTDSNSSSIISDGQNISNVRDNAVDQDSLDSEIIRFNSNVTLSDKVSSQPSQTSFLNTGQSKTRILSTKEGDSDSETEVLYYIRTLFEEKNEGRGTENSIDESSDSEESCCVCCCCCCFPSFCCCKSKAKRSKRNNVTIVGRHSSGIKPVSRLSIPDVCDENSNKAVTINEGYSTISNDTQNMGHKQTDTDNVASQDTDVANNKPGISVSGKSNETPGNISLPKEKDSNSEILNDNNEIGTNVLQDNNHSSVMFDEAQSRNETNNENSVLQIAPIANPNGRTCCFCCFPCLCSCKSRVVGTELNTLANDKNENPEHTRIGNGVTSISTNEDSRKPVTENRGKETDTKHKIPLKNTVTSTTKDRTDKSKNENLKSDFDKTTTGERSSAKSFIKDKKAVHADNQMANTDRFAVGDLSDEGDNQNDTQHLNKEKKSAKKEARIKDDAEVVDLQDMDSGTGKHASCFCFFGSRSAKKESVKRPESIVGTDNNSSNIVQSDNNGKVKDKPNGQTQEKQNQNNKLSVPYSTTSQSQTGIENQTQTPISSTGNKVDEGSHSRDTGKENMDNNADITKTKQQSKTTNNALDEKASTKQNISNMPTDLQNSGDAEQTSCFCCLRARPRPNLTAEDSDQRRVSEVCQVEKENPNISVSVTCVSSSNNVETITTEHGNDQFTSERLSHETQEQNVSSNARSDSKENDANVRQTFAEKEQEGTNEEVDEPGVDTRGNTELSIVDKHQAGNNAKGDQSIIDSRSINKSRQGTNKPGQADTDRTLSESEASIDKDLTGASDDGMTSKGIGDTSKTTLVDKEKIHTEPVKNSDSPRAISEHKRLDDDNGTNETLASQRQKTKHLTRSSVSPFEPVTSTVKTTCSSDHDNGISKSSHLSETGNISANQNSIADDDSNQVYACLNEASLADDQLDDSRTDTAKSTDAKKIILEPSNLDKSSSVIHKGSSYDDTLENDKQDMSNEMTSIEMEEKVAISSINVPDSKRTIDQSDSSEMSDSANRNDMNNASIFPVGQVKTKNVDHETQNDQGNRKSLNTDKTTSELQVSKLDENDNTVSMENYKILNFNDQKLENDSTFKPKLLRTNQNSFTPRHEHVSVSNYSASIKGRNSEVKRVTDADKSPQISSSNQTQSPKQNCYVKQPSTVDAFWGSFVNDEKARTEQTKDIPRSHNIMHTNVPDITNNIKQEANGREQGISKAKKDSSKNSEGGLKIAESSPNLIHVTSESGILAASNVVPNSKVSLPSKQQNIANKKLSVSARKTTTSNIPNISAHDKSTDRTRTMKNDLIAVNDSISNTTNNRSRLIHPSRDRKTDTVNKVNQNAKPFSHTGDKFANNIEPTKKSKDLGTADTKVLTLPSRTLNVNKEMKRSYANKTESGSSVSDKDTVSDETNVFPNKARNQTRSSFRAMGGGFNESNKETAIQTTKHTTKQNTDVDGHVHGDTNNDKIRNKDNALKHTTMKDKVGVMTSSKQEMVKHEQGNETLPKASNKPSNETQMPDISNRDDKQTVSRFRNDHAVAKTRPAKETDDSKSKTKQPTTNRESQANQKVNDNAQIKPSLQKENNVTKKFSILKKTNEKKPSVDNHLEVGNSATMMESSRNGTHGVSVGNAMDKHKGASVAKPDVVAAKQNVSHVQQGSFGQRTKVSQEVVKPVNATKSLRRKEMVDTPGQNEHDGKSTVMNTIVANTSGTKTTANSGEDSYGKEKKRSEQLNSNLKSNVLPAKERKVQKTNIVTDALSQGSTNNKYPTINVKGSHTNKTDTDVVAVHGTRDSNVKPLVGDVSAVKSLNTVKSKNLKVKNEDNRPPYIMKQTNADNNTLVNKHVTGKDGGQNIAKNNKDQFVSKELPNANTKNAKPPNLDSVHNSSDVKAARTNISTTKVLANKDSENKRPQMKHPHVSHTQSEINGLETEKPILYGATQSRNDKDKNAVRFRVDTQRKFPQVSGGLQVKYQEKFKGYSDSKTKRQTITSKSINTTQPKNGNFISGKISKGKVHLESSADTKKPIVEYIQHQTSSPTDINNRVHGNKNNIVNDFHSVSNTANTPTKAVTKVKSVNLSVSTKVPVGISRIPKGNETNLQKSKPLIEANNMSANHGEKGQAHNKTTINTSARGEIITQKPTIKEKNKPILPTTSRGVNNQKASIAKTDVIHNKGNATKIHEVTNTFGNNTGKVNKTNVLIVTPAHNTTKGQKDENPKDTLTSQNVKKKHTETDKITGTVSKNVPSRQPINKQRTHNIQHGGNEDSRESGYKSSIAQPLVRGAGEMTHNKQTKPHDKRSIANSTNSTIPVYRSSTPPNEGNAEAKKGTAVGALRQNQIKNHAENTNNNVSVVNNNINGIKQDVRRQETNGARKSVSTSHTSSNSKIKDNNSVKPISNKGKIHPADKHFADNNPMKQKPTTGKTALQNPTSNEKNKVPMFGGNHELNNVNKVSFANSTAQSDKFTLSKDKNKSGTSFNGNAENNTRLINVKP